MELKRRGNPKNVIQLLGFGVTREERGTAEELTKDAPNTPLCRKKKIEGERQKNGQYKPHVNRCVVLPATE
jgi:hypothetical protein